MLFLSLRRYLVGDVSTRAMLGLLLFYGAALFVSIDVWKDASIAITVIVACDVFAAVSWASLTRIVRKKKRKKKNRRK